MPFLDYNDKLRAGITGALADDGPCDFLSLVASDPQAVEVVSVTAQTDPAGADRTSRLYIFGVEISIAVLAADTPSQVADKYVAEIAKESSLSGIISAEQTGGALVLTGLVEGVPLSVTTTDADLVVAITTPAADAARVPYGRMVVRTADRRGRLVKESDLNGTQPDELLVSVHDQFHRSDVGNSAEPNATIAGLRKGRLFVEVEGPVAIGDEVYVRTVADGSLDRIGAFSNSAGTGKVRIDDKFDCHWHRGVNSAQAVLQLR